MRENLITAQYLQADYGDGRRACSAAARSVASERRLRRKADALAEVARARRPARHAGRRAAVRHAQAGRDRHRPGHRPRRAAARRAVVGHGAGGGPPARRRAARAAPTVRPVDRDDRAPRAARRAGLRLRLLPRLRPAADRRAARTTCATTRRSSPPTSARIPTRLAVALEAAARRRCVEGELMALLEVEDLRVGYGFPVLMGISFDVEEGETAVLFGLNGAGKTTTVATDRRAAEARRRRRSASTARTSPGGPPTQLVGQGIALVPEGRRVFPALSVANNLRLGAWTRRRERRRGRAAPPARLRVLPAPRRARRPGRRHAVGRRAADARHRPGADVEARGCCSSTRRRSGSARRWPRPCSRSSSGSTTTASR